PTSFSVSRQEGSLSILREQLLEVIRATTVHRDGTFSWFGQRSRPLPADLRRHLDPEMVRDHLLAGLRSCLYSNFYCQGAPTPLRVERPEVGRGSERMAPRLAAANVGKGSWDPGWRVEAAASGQAAIIKNGLRLFAWPDEYRKESDRPTVPGDLVSLLWPKDCLGLSPGYFTALGDEPLEDAGRTRLRLYWHIRPEGAVQLIRRITTELNASKVGFRFKVVDDLGSYGRCDAAVLYISDRDFPRVTELLAGSAGDLREGGALDQEIPAFTKRLAHGLGLAEDPPDGDSFGLNRCTLLARALTTEEGTRSRSAALKLRLVEE